MDPFCGCGTTIASAIKNGRKWIGIDISWDAVQIMQERIKSIGFIEKYEFLDGNPATREEYEKLNAYQKQDWLIKKVKGYPNQKKSGDRGVDGELGIYLGIDKNRNDIWGKMIFSVKTGKQRNPNMIRELIGSMKIHNADMGALILDCDSTDGMDAEAQRQGQIKYFASLDIPPRFIDKVQIITSQEIIDGLQLDLPPTQTEMMLHRNRQLSFNG